MSREYFHRPKPYNWPPEWPTGEYYRGIYIGLGIPRHKHAVVILIISGRGGVNWFNFTSSNSIQLNILVSIVQFNSKLQIELNWIVESPVRITTYSTRSIELHWDQKCLGIIQSRSVPRLPFYHPLSPYWAWSMEKAQWLLQDKLNEKNVRNLVSYLPTLTDYKYIDLSGNRFIQQGLQSINQVSINLRIRAYQSINSAQRVQPWVRRVIWWPSVDYIIIFICMISIPLLASCQQRIYGMWSLLSITCDQIMSGSWREEPLQYIVGRLVNHFSSPGLRASYDTVADRKTVINSLEVFEANI